MRESYRVRPSQSPGPRVMRRVGQLAPAGWPSLNELFVPRGSLGDFGEGMGVFGTVVERAVGDRPKTHFGMSG